MDRKNIIIVKKQLDKKTINDIIRVFKGRDYELFYGHYPNHTKEFLSKHRHSHNRYYVIGGDGFIHEAIQSLANTENELVIVPMGTGNDLARSIMLNKEPLDFINDSFDLPASKIDLLKANDIYCVNNICIGLDAYVGAHVHDGGANWLKGPIKYFYSTIRYLRHLDGFMSEIYYKDKRIYDGKLLLGAFCNGGYYGGGVQIGKFAKLDDGLIDVNLMRGINLFQLLMYLPFLFTKNLDKLSKFYHRKVANISFNSSIEVVIDGEIYPKGKYDVSVEKQALNIVLYK